MVHIVTDLEAAAQEPWVGFTVPGPTFDSAFFFPGDALFGVLWICGGGGTFA